MPKQLMRYTGILFLLLGVGSIPFIPLSDTDTTFDTIRGALAGLGIGLVVLSYLAKPKDGL